MAVLLIGDYVEGGAGNPVIYWWLDSETTGTDDIYTYRTLVITDFDPFQQEMMYFGNWSECHSSGFIACR